MDKALRRMILDKWKNVCISSIKLPSGFLFSEENGVLTMTFRSKRGMGLGDNPYNIQDDAAAFEGWALALYVHYLNRSRSVCLDIPENLPQDSEDLYMKFNHYSRFLYRVLRFSQHYSHWFCPSDRLRERAEGFGAFLEKYNFTNNPPSGSVQGKKKPEGLVESRFVNRESKECSWLLQKLGADEVFRQLPVGLFRNTASNENRIFPGGSAAIDLWTLSDGILTVLELKTDGNVEIGVLTELFFYTNYICDMFVKQDNNFHPNTRRGDRGYKALLSDSLKKVHGCLLLDEKSRHPLITDTMLSELSQGAIPYDCLIYQLDTAREVALQEQE